MTQATLLAVLLSAILSDAPVASRPSALGIVEKTQRATVAVTERLDQADKDVKAGKIDEGLERAIAADALAREALHPSDPGRTRAAVVAARIRYTKAAREKDGKLALKWASEARQASLENSDPKAAQRWAEIAVSLAKTALATDDPELGRVGLQLELTRCISALTANDLPAARKSIDIARGDAEKLFKPGDLDRVTVFMRLAQIEFHEGHRDAAEATLAKVVSEIDPGRPELRRPRLEALTALAQLRVLRGAPDARATQAQCLVAAASLGDPVDSRALAACQIVAAFAWSQMVADAQKTLASGDYAKAMAGLVDEVRVFRAELEKAGADRATAALGDLFVAKFQYDAERASEAEKTLARFDAETGGAEAEQPLTIGDYWTLRGLVATEKGDYATARDCHDRAFRSYYRARLPQQAIALNNLGLLLLRQGDYDSAEAILRGANAFSIADPSLKGDPQRASILTNLAKCLESNNNLPEALRLHKEALAIAQGMKPPRAFLIMACLNNVGLNRYLAGELDDAAARYEEARKLAVANFGATHFRVAETDVNRAWLAIAQEKPEEADALFKASLDVFRERGDDHPRVAETLSYVARVQAKGGQKEKALAAINEALALQEKSLIRTFRSPLSERDRLAVVQELRVHPESSVWPGVLDTYLELVNNLGVPPTEQYQRLLAWKGVMARHATPRVDELENEPEIRSLARERELRLAALREASVARMAGKARMGRGEQSRLESEIEELERSLARKSARFSQGVGSVEVAPARVAAALPAGSALLDVIEVRRFKVDDTGEVLKDFRYVGFLVRPDRPVERVELAGSAPVINSAILAFRADIEGRRDLKTSGQTLAAMVRDPLLPKLEGIHTLIVAGDDLINYLPMGALPGKTPGRFWVEDLTFGAVTSAQSLVERHERKVTMREGAVIVGGIDFATWPKLSGTIAEAAEVARSYRTSHKSGDLDQISGSEATPDRLRNLLPIRRFVHLATHGFFQADKGEGLFKTHGSSAEFDSGIVLAGPKSSHSDDMLTAEEIGLLDLRGTELVVLSACESGLGRLRAGQGVIGLVGALDRAGVASVVSTLWKVSDEGTVPFMAAFYRHLWSEGSPIGAAKAVRAAQLDMIKGVAKGEKGTVYAHPFYWAAFVQVGDPAPTRSR